MNPGTPLLASLDAATYFLLNSGGVILATAVLFLMVGLWMGRMTWGRGRNRLRDAEDVIETFKTEVATLKRRIAEQSSRATSTFQHPAALGMNTGMVTTAALRGPSFPRSRMFYTWGEAAWEPPKISAQHLHGSQAFSIWTTPDYVPPLACLFLPSRAASLWTEPGWAPPQVRWPTPRSSRAFCLWTLPDFEPAKRVLYTSGNGFSLWTEPGWTPPPAQGAALPRSRAFSMWTEANFVPERRILMAPGKAFSIWTEDGWKIPVVRESLPRSQAFTLWLPEDSPISAADVPPDGLAIGAQSSAGKPKGSVVARALSVLGFRRVKEAAAPTPAAPRAAPATTPLPVAEAPLPPPSAALVPSQTSGLEPEPEQAPAPVLHWPPSLAFTLWTEPDWAPVLPSAPRSAILHSAKSASAERRPAKKPASAGVTGLPRAVAETSKEPAPAPAPQVKTPEVKPHAITPFPVLEFEEEP